MVVIFYIYIRLIYRTQIKQQIAGTGSLLSGKKLSTVCATRNVVTAYTKVRLRTGS